MNMFQTKHELTEGEKACLEPYEREKSPKPRKNLIKLIRHMNMLNPFPDEKSWEYIFLDRQVNDAQVDFCLKMKHRHPYTIRELAEAENETFSWLCRGLSDAQVAELLNATDLMLQNAWGEYHTKGGSCGCD
jgi:hypothetical protein